MLQKEKNCHQDSVLYNRIRHGIRSWALALVEPLTDLKLRYAMSVQRLENLLRRLVR